MPVSGCTPDLETGAVTQLASGHDFYSSPSISPDGNLLAFVAWDHPSMPWDDTSIYLAAFDEKGLLQEPRLVVGCALVAECGRLQSRHGGVFAVAVRNAVDPHMHRARAHGDGSNESAVLCITAAAAFTCEKLRNRPPRLVCCRVVAGGTDQSVQQPVWGPDGSLYYVGDASGWWNLYRVAYKDIQEAEPQVRAVPA